MKKLLLIPSATILLSILLIKASGLLDIIQFLDVTVIGLVVAALIAIVGTIYFIRASIQARLITLSDAAIMIYLLAMPFIIGELAFG